MSRANYDLPDGILLRAKRLSGAPTKRRAIIIALKEYVRKKRIEELIALRGKIRLDWTGKSLARYRG